MDVIYWIFGIFAGLACGLVILNWYINKVFGQVDTWSVDDDSEI